MFIGILSGVVKLCLAMGIGFWLEKKGIFNVDVRSRLTRILLDITMPCTLIMSFQIVLTKALFNTVILVLVISVFMHVLFIIMGYIFCKIMKIKNPIKDQLFMELRL